MAEETSLDKTVVPLTHMRPSSKLLFLHMLSFRWINEIEVVVNGSIRGSPAFPFLSPPPAAALRGCIDFCRCCWVVIAYALILVHRVYFSPPLGRVQSSFAVAARRLRAVRFVRKTYRVISGSLSRRSVRGTCMLSALSLIGFSWRTSKPLNEITNFEIRGRAWYCSIIL